MDAARLFSLVPSNRTRVSGHKPERSESIRALEQAAHSGGGAIDSGGVQRALGCCVEGHGLARTIGEGLMVGLDDPVGLFQP